MDNSLYEMLVSSVCPELADAHKKLINGEISFVHYTSAEAAYAMLSTESVFLRNVRYMNDWQEVDYGRSMLIEIYNSEVGDALKLSMDKIDDKFKAQFEIECDNLIHDLERYAYIMCISEHLEEEDRFGRLSMWRAYGGKCGVAIVLNHNAFSSDSDVLGAYSAPVLYYQKSDVENIFSNLTKLINEFHSLINTEEIRNQVMFYFKYMFRILCLCVKHPGFKEEREWRIFHVKNEDQKGKLEYETRSLNGFPQSLCVLHLRDYSDEGYKGTGLSDLVKKVIIGPTDFAEPTRDCFFELMGEHGIEDIQSKLTISGIPLRQ